MRFGPVWDFDGAFGVWTSDPLSLKREYLVNKSIYMKNCKFVLAYFQYISEEQYEKFQDRYNELYDDIINTAIDIIGYKEFIAKEAEINIRRWYNFNIDAFYEQYNSVSTFFIGHTVHLKSIFSEDLITFKSIYLDI